MSDEAGTGPQGGAAGKGDANEDRPKVAFAHAFFNKLEDVHFRLSPQDHIPVMVVRFAKNEISLPFGGIKKELQIGDSEADAVMLDTVARSLNYLKGLRIGDFLPREILTREASWTLSERHIKIAYQRIGVQLVNWMTGGQSLVTDPDQLLQLADDPQIKKMINQAFGEAAERLGLGRDHKEEVILHVQSLAHELAYIEALRDRYRHIIAMREKVQGLRRIYGRERSVLEVADQVARLSERAVKEMEDQFLEIDAQTGEILSVLRNLDNQIAYIRDKRDEIHARLMAWDEVLNEWDRVVVKASDDKPEVLRRAYQFLAPRYMMVNEWVLMTKPPKVAKPKSMSQMGAGGQLSGKPSKVMPW